MRSSECAGVAMAVLLFSLALNAFAVAAPAAQAGEEPIIVGKPIITKDPPKPKKGDGEVSGAVAGNGKESRL